MDIIILIISLLLLYQKKLAWVLLALILLTTSYLNAGTSISEFPFLHNVSDSGLILYIVLSLYILYKNNFRSSKTPFSKNIKFFYLFLLVSILIDLLVNGIDLLSIVKTSRHWIFLSCIWIFYYIPEKDVKELIKYLLNSLAIISIIMLIEFFFNIQLLGKEVKTEYLRPGFLIERGSIPSIFLIFFILLLFSGYFKFNTKLKYLYISIFSTVLITSMIRSWFFATIIGIFLVLNLQEKFRIKRIFAAGLIAIGLIFIVYNNPIIQERFSAGLEEVQGFSLSGNIQGTLSFRILLAVERLNYISQNIQYAAFGLGNVTEYNFPNIFYFGLSDITGRVTQLDTSDIAWSILFLRLGLLGLIVYLFFYIKVLKIFYRLRFSNTLAFTMFIYLLITISMISFSTSEMATGQFWLFPVLAYYSIHKK